VQRRTHRGKHTPSGAAAPGRAPLRMRRSPHPGGTGAKGRARPRDAKNMRHADGRSL
jgi:hypothetical protein